MTREEKDKYLLMMSRYKRLLNDTVSNIAAYDSWSDGFCRKKVQDLYGLLIEQFKGVDFTQFNEDELKQLDFRWFDDNLLCFPVWVIDCLAEGTKVYSISGKEIIWEIQTDKSALKVTRLGVTAYGFNRSQLRDSRIESILES